MDVMFLRYASGHTDIPEVTETDFVHIEIIPPDELSADWCPPVDDDWGEAGGDACGGVGCVAWAASAWASSGSWNWAAPSTNSSVQASSTRRACRQDRQRFIGIWQPIAGLLAHAK